MAETITCDYCEHWCYTLRIHIAHMKAKHPLVIDVEG